MLGLPLLIIDGCDWACPLLIIDGCAWACPLLIIDGCAWACPLLIACRWMYSLEVARILSSPQTVRVMLGIVGGTRLLHGASVVVRTHLGGWLKDCSGKVFPTLESTLSPHDSLRTRTRPHSPSPAGTHLSNHSGRQPAAVRVTRPCSSLIRAISGESADGRCLDKSSVSLTHGSTSCRGRELGGLAPNQRYPEGVGFENGLRRGYNPRCRPDDGRG